MAVAEAGRAVLAGVRVAVEVAVTFGVRVKVAVLVAVGTGVLVFSRWADAVLSIS